jgi:hypothetical protein
MRNSRFLIVAALVLILGGAAFWWFHRPEKIPHTPGASAPAVGSCWSVDATAARSAFPWSGAPVACTDTHTAEVYHVGQVDDSLIRQEHGAKGDNKTIADNLMYAEARLACANFASVYLGASWHDGRVSVVANWIAPARDGFFGCALAQVADPAGQHLLPRTASLQGALAGDGAADLAVSCVDASGGYIGCDQAHRSEYVGAYTITPANAPFNGSALQTAVTTGCTQLIQTYLGGTGPARSDLTAAYVGPTTASDWLGSDQTYACYAKAAADIRGTVRNLGTRPLPH